MNTLQKFDRRLARLEQKNFVGVAGEPIILGGSWGAAQRETTFNIRMIYLNDLPTLVVDIPRNMMEELEADRTVI